VWIVYPCFKPLSLVLLEELRIRVKYARHQGTKKLRRRLEKIQQMSHLVFRVDARVVPLKDRRQRKWQRLQPRLKALFLIEPIERLP